jgi:hypothetical protein
VLAVRTAAKPVEVCVDGTEGRRSRIAKSILPFILIKLAHVIDPVEELGIGDVNFVGPDADHRA